MIIMRIGYHIVMIIISFVMIVSLPIKASLQDICSHAEPFSSDGADSNMETAALYVSLFRIPLPEYGYFIAHTNSLFIPVLAAAQKERPPKV
jgi:hypothetical protein